MFTFIYFHCLYFNVCSISFHVFCFSSSSSSSSCVSLLIVRSFLLSAFRCVLNIFRQIYINSYTHTHSCVYIERGRYAIHSHSMRVERCEYKPIHGLPFVYSARDHAKQAMNAFVAAVVAVVYMFKEEWQRAKTGLTIFTCMTSLH